MQATAGGNVVYLASRGRGLSVRTRPTRAQREWLRRGLTQPGGKLPLFDRDGQRMDTRLVRSAIFSGWAEPWFSNPLKPDWLVCRLTERGRAVLAALQQQG
jgi:hypothetical protein